MKVMLLRRGNRFAILTALSVVLAWGSSASGAKSSSAWKRVKRVAVYTSPRRARYPSITTAADGSLLVLLTRQTVEQEKAGRGDLVVTRSADKGVTWSGGRVVFHGDVGEPHARGTMTTLKSGRIVAPFAEISASRGAPRSTLRLLSSDDNGTTWQASALKVTSELTWLAPSGKVLESADGTLSMPIYGAASAGDLKATIHNSGVVRSTDGGKTWGDVSWLARGGGGVVGAVRGVRFSFEGPVVRQLPDGRWLALMTARRLDPSTVGPGSPHVICRLWSADEGRTWTEPDQLTPGAWPGLGIAGQHALCANTHWAAWGGMQLEVSRDGFESIFQELPLMRRGWISGRTNNPKEVPPPPTVPHLADSWQFEHYGFPSIEAIDNNSVAVVFGRTQWGTPYYHEFDPPELDQIPMEMEKIQAVFYERASHSEENTRNTASRPQGRWVLTERILVPDLDGPMAQLPDGDLIATVGGTLRQSSDGGRTWTTIPGATLPENLGALGVLQSGRWLASSQIVNQEWRGGGATIVGDEGGYPVRKSRMDQSYDAAIVVSHSDNRGKTWHPSVPFKGPFQWAVPSVSHFIESADGTIALPIFGCVTDEEMRSYSSSNGVIRSRDGGRTWGDFSFVFRTNSKGPDDHQPEPRFSEMDIVALPNGHWVAYSRNERIGAGPQGMGATAVAVSTDLGRTWRKTGGSLVGVSQQKGVVLPDGGIALSYRSHSWQQAGVAITYDEGHSFSSFLAGPYETMNAFLTAKEEFAVFTGKSRRSDSLAAVYRWKPRSEPTPSSETSIAMRNPRSLDGPIACERIALGARGDYKPCIAKLPNGELLLVAFDAAKKIDGKLCEDMLLWRSSDGGRTWSDRQVIPPLGREPYFTVLDDGTVFISVHFLQQDIRNKAGYVYSMLHRSTDGGRTWTTTDIRLEDVPGAKAGDSVITGRNVVKLKDGTLIFGVGVRRGPEYLWRSRDNGKTWDKTLACTYHGADQTKMPFPILGEAFYWQARSGDLLAVCRVTPTIFPPIPGTGIPEQKNDHYERMVLFRSKDGGHNWHLEELGSYYGEMYPAILRLNDGRLLFTFTLREAIPPQEPPLGVRAVLGVETDDGFQFDFNHDRIVIDAKTRVDNDSGGGFGPTVQLDDGTLVTSYSYRGPSDGGTDLNIEVVRWRLPE